MYIYLYIYIYRRCKSTEVVLSKDGSRGLKREETRRERREKESKKRANSNMQESKKEAKPISDMLFTTQTKLNSRATAPNRYAQHHSKRHHQNESVSSLKIAQGVQTTVLASSPA